MKPTNGTSEGRFNYKAGKLIKVRAIFQGEKIKEIKITGDFFLHPEEKIEEIENGLKDVNVNNIRGIIEEKMKNAEYAGISPEELEYVIKEAWKRRK